jgi:hypothetical protein
MCRLPGTTRLVNLLSRKTHDHWSLGNTPGEKTDRRIPCKLGSWSVEIPRFKNTDHRTLDQFTFQVRGQISLSISLHCLRVTPQATLSPAGTSKPRDTQSETHDSGERLPLAFPHSNASRTYTHTLRHGGRPFSTSRECSSSQELDSRNAPSWPSQGLIRQCRCAWESYAVGGHLTPLEHMFSSCHALHSASARACTAFPKRLRSLIGSLYIHMRNLRKVSLSTALVNMSAIISLVEMR